MFRGSEQHRLAFREHEEAVKMPMSPAQLLRVECSPSAVFREETVPGAFLLAKYKTYKVTGTTLVGIYFQFASNPGVISID